MKNIGVFYLKIFSFWGVKFSIYLNMRVFLMYIICLLVLGKVLLQHKSIDIFLLSH